MVNVIKDRPNWQAIEICFKDGVFLHFDSLTTQLKIESKYMEARRDDLELTRNYNTLPTGHDKESSSTAACGCREGYQMDRNALGYLTDLNRNVECAVALLEKLAEYPELNNEDFIIFQSYFREYLADTNLVVLDALGESEHKTMLTANRERVAFEKKIRDPDDCYFDVRNREEELWAQGKPSKIGVLRGMRRLAAEEILSYSHNDDDEFESDEKSGSGQAEASGDERGI